MSEKKSAKNSTNKKNTKDKDVVTNKAENKKTTNKKTETRKTSAKSTKKPETKKVEKVDEPKVIGKVEVNTEKFDKKEKNSFDIKSLNSKVIATIVVICLVIVAIGYVIGTIIGKNTYQTKNPVATMEIENYGKVVIELFPEYAPNTVTNFIALANNGFYNGKTFHRTIPDFMIQGGDPNGDGSGNATLKALGKDSDEQYSIKGEFVLNGFTQNSLKHEKGVISMARSDYSSYNSSLADEGYNSGSCQFFITTKATSSLDGQYAAFGKVIDGMDIVEKISNVDVETRDNTTDNTLRNDRPKNPPVIKSLTVDTHGVDYGMPETQKPFDYYSYMMKQYYGSQTINH